VYQTSFQFNGTVLNFVFSKVVSRTCCFESSSGELEGASPLFDAMVAIDYVLLFPIIGSAVTEMVFGGDSLAEFGLSRRGFSETARDQR
jgi:hypothetical protein